MVALKDLGFTLGQVATIVDDEVELRVMLRLRRAELHEQIAADTARLGGVMPTIQTLSRWISAHGYRSTGYNREVYLQYGEGAPESWETEPQESVEVG